MTALEAASTALTVNPHGRGQVVTWRTRGLLAALVRMGVLDGDAGHGPFGPLARAGGGGG